MTTQDEQLKQITEIRDLMERSSRFLSLSGYSGIFAGLFALLGALVAFWYFDFNLNYLQLNDKIYDEQGFVKISFLIFVFIDAAAVLFFSLLFAWFFSKAKARKNGLKFWNRSARRTLVNMLIPLITGGLLVLIMLLHNHVAYLAGLTLIFYGFALVNASKYTFEDIRYLGLLELLLGLLACYFVNYGLLFWSLGFGVLHIIYGILLYNKYDRKKEAAAR